MDNDNVRASAADAAAADPPTLEVEQGPAGTIDSENESDEQESNAGNTDSDSSDINDWMDAVQSAEGSVAKKAASSGNREDTALPGSSNGPVIGAWRESGSGSQARVSAGESCCSSRCS